MGHRMLPTAFSPIDPCCHGNEIWDKIDYNSACVRDFFEIFAPRPMGGSRGWAIECCQLHFSLTDPRCHANEIWDKITKGDIIQQHIDTQSV